MAAIEGVVPARNKLIWVPHFRTVAFLLFVAVPGGRFSRTHVSEPRHTAPRPSGTTCHTPNHAQPQPAPVVPAIGKYRNRLSPHGCPALRPRTPLSNIRDPL